MDAAFQVFNDPDVILAQTQAGVSASPLLQAQVQAGAVTSIGGATGTSITIVSGSGAGFSITPSGTPGQLSLSVGVSNATTARGALNAAEKATPAITGAVIPLAKITGGGADGSLTVNAEGIVTAYLAPT